MTASNRREDGQPGGAGDAVDQEAVSRHKVLGKAIGVAAAGQ